MVIPAQMMNFHNELMGWEEYPTEDFLNHWPDTGAEIQHMMMIQDTHYLGDILDQGLRPSKVAHQMKIQDQSHLGEPRSAAITPTIPSSENPQHLFLAQIRLLEEVHEGLHLLGVNYHLIIQGYDHQKEVPYIIIAINLHVHLLIEPLRQIIDQADPCPEEWPQWQDL